MQPRCSQGGGCQSQIWTPLRTHRRGNASSGLPGFAPVQLLQGQQLLSLVLIDAHIGHRSSNTRMYTILEHFRMA